MWILFRRCGRLLSYLLMASLFVLTSGCGRNGTVSGIVYYKGQPLKVGMVQFFPEKKGGDFSSPIGSDGSYSISKLPVGNVRVSVISNTTNPMANMPPMAGGPFAKKGMKGAAEMMKKSKTDGEGDSSTPF